MPKKGRKGTEQRVKGNAKSASSGRMTELLGGEAVGFIGFDRVSSGLPGVGTDTIVGQNGRGEKTNELLILRSGAKFQVVMKQLGKRDTTTKLKALQSFCDLCGEEAQQDVVTVLNIWSIMYNKLGMDNDNRVRTMSHKALGACAVSVKSSLAPYLKSIIASWVSGMCDPHGPSATAAKMAFDEAFPSKKQTEVLEFGFKAIFKHTEEMVLKETPDTFSDPKVVPVDERTQRYERALVMAVHSISFILRRLTTLFVGKASDVYESFLLEKRLWKLNRHSNPYVRSATFILVSALCEQIPQFATRNVKLLCSAVLGSLAEDDPVVIGPLWEACLLLITKTENWSEHVNVQKALLPGLWSFLKAGGYGSAKFTYPCLLPLLSILIDKVFSGDPDFARLFLERLESGLHCDRIRISRSESGLVLMAYNECFLYLVFNLKPLEEEECLGKILRLLQELLDFSLTKECSQTQSEVIFGSVVKLLSRLVQSGDKNPSLKKCLAWFRDSLTETLASCLGASAEQKPAVSIGKLKGLLSNFHSPPKSSKAKGSSVRFLEQPLPQAPSVDVTDSDIARGHVTLSSVESLFESAEMVPLPDEFVKPVVCLVCVKCISIISEHAQENYSTLLLTLVRLFCADSSFSTSLLSCLRDTDPALVFRLLGDASSSVSPALPTLLSKVARLDSLSEQSSKFSSALVECIVILAVYSQEDEDDTKESVWKVLTELCQNHEAILPLVLSKLGEFKQREKVELIMSGCGHLLNGLLVDLRENRQIYLWEFLDMLFSSGQECLFAGMDVANIMLSLVGQQLCDVFSKPLSDGENLSIRNMLRVVCGVQRSLVQSQVEICTKFLECLLKWSLVYMDTSAGDDLDILEGVVRAYSHVVASLPDPLTYLQTCSVVVMSAMATNMTGLSCDEIIARHIQSALVYSSLHSHLLSQEPVYPALYAHLIKLPRRIEDSLFPLSSLDTFCKGELLFSPLFTNLDSSAIVDGLTGSLMPLIYPAILLCDLEAHEFELEPSSTNTSPVNLSKLQARLSEICTKLGCNIGHSLLIFGCGKPGGSDGNKCRENEETRIRIWTDTVLSLSLACCCLRESEIKRNNSMETRLAAVFQSAVDTCLRIGGNCHHWLEQLVELVVEKASMKGPIWISVLHLIVSALGKQTGIDLPSIWQDLTKALYKDPEGATIYSALQSSDSDLYKNQIEQMATNRQSDPCLLMGCLQLLPDNTHLLSLCSNVLCEISDKQNSSDITLFENLSEAEQDPMSFSTLGLISLLLKQQRLPPQVWDFIHCSLVSIVQLLADSGTNSGVNRTVFVCRVFELLHQICLHFQTSVVSPEHAKEWLEFFQPALQGLTLTLFLKQFESTPPNPCLRYQQTYLSKVVSVLCTKPEGVGLEQLMDMVLSDSYPHQIAAYSLSERLLDACTIIVSEEPNWTIPGEFALKLSFLQGLFAKCIEQINIDLVFFEDTHSLEKLDVSSKVTYQHTPAYLLTWLLIIRTMSLCNPETRGVMTDWLKELSLFDHLLHGLVKFVSDSKSKTVEMALKVTMMPRLVELSHVTYNSVARHLPCMLRQWYLTLDRQTSSQVSWFTTKFVSPALQKSELQSISKTQSTYGNMEVRVYSGVSEVSVVYHVDEFSIELFVRLPESYPLQPPLIREGKRVRVEQAQWRKWLLQLNIFVTNQNGSLMDGLLLWKSNLDKHFSGVEDCMICFSVIHSSNYSLPKMNCRTCRKKFHSACLYKWFNTSNKSSCPLCRNIF